MFIPIEGEDCIFLENVVALVHEDGVTTVSYTDGHTCTTGFRPRTLLKRYNELMEDALHVELPGSQQEVKNI